MKMGYWWLMILISGWWLIGWPTPLKNHGVRQLGWLFHSQVNGKSSKFHGSSQHQAEISYIQYIPIFVGEIHIIFPFRWKFPKDFPAALPRSQPPFAWDPPVMSPSSSSTSMKLLRYLRNWLRGWGSTLKLISLVGGFNHYKPSIIWFIMVNILLLYGFVWKYRIPTGRFV